MTISSRIAGVSAFFLAAALFYAPLAYGCTRPDMLPTLFGLLLASIVTGVISFLVKRRWPAIPRLALICMAAILIQGWWMTWNPVFPSLISAEGGVVNTTMENIRQLSFDSMVVVSFLLVSFAVLCGLYGQANLRRFILLAVAFSGAIVSPRRNRAQAQRDLLLCSTSGSRRTMIGTILLSTAITETPVLS